MKAILWDFDGTLAARNGMWSGALLAVARHALPERRLTKEEIRPFLQTGFPWHAPERSHPGQTPDEWWAALNAVFASAYVAVGVEPKLAEDLAGRVREEFLDPTQWSVFEDVVPCLSSLERSGWTHCVLSNHVPELPRLVNALDLSSFFAEVSSSAMTGYEKPHPEAFRGLLCRLPADCRVWVVGDSFTADVQGARSVGLPAILVRKRHDDAEHFCQSLSEIAGILSCP